MSYESPGIGPWSHTGNRQKSLMMDGNLVMPKSRFLVFLGKELKELLPPTVFFAVSFNLILLTTQLILADYLIHFFSFLVATTSALVVGKSVLLADALPFFRRFARALMIQSILFKTIVYWSVVFLVRFLEKLVEYWFGGGTTSGVSDYVANHFSWHRFAAIQIWIFVLFLIYTSFADLNTRLGKGELVKILFSRPPATPQQSGVATTDATKV
jgi:hypothetical protein